MTHPAESLIDLTDDGLGQRFTQKGAARVCGVALNTIKRRRAAGAFPNAVSDDGIWRIPLADLLAAGLNPGRPTAAEPAPDQDTAQPDTLEVRLAVAEAQLTERDAAHAAEQAAAQREADALRAQLRQIEAARDQAADHAAQIRSQARQALEEARHDAKALGATVTRLWIAVAALAAFTAAALMTVLALVTR